MGRRIEVRIVAEGDRPGRGWAPWGRRPVLPQWGSDHMRGAQLAALLAPHLPERVAVSAVAVARESLRRLDPEALGPRADVYLLLKNVAQRLDQRAAARLRAHARVAVGADHIDGEPARIDIERFDFHVAASLSGLAALGRACAASGRPVGLVHHHADPGLDALAPPQREVPAAVYLGHPDNLVLPPALASLVTVLPITSAADMARAMPGLPRFNLHYAVRPEPGRAAAERAHKPFTKGFTAAACRSNIVVNRGADDALAFLGEDYPYLARDAGTAAATEALDRALGDFGTPAWDAALERMAAMRDRVSPARIAAQFVALMDRIAG